MTFGRIDLIKEKSTLALETLPQHLTDNLIMSINLARHNYENFRYIVLRTS